MSGSGVLQAGWSLAANDEGTAPRNRGRTAMEPATVALICASRMSDHGFEVLSAPGCRVPLVRDARGVFQFLRAAAPHPVGA